MTSPCRTDTKAARGALLVLIAGVAWMVVSTPAFARNTLDVLTWCDHEDPALLGPFEKANDVKVNFKDIDSTAAALAVLGQSKPGDWDAVIRHVTEELDRLVKNHPGTLEENPPRQP